MSRGRFIYFAGADGTGKSTHAQLLVEHLRNNGVSCQHLWLRFPFLLSLPLLFYARWRGYAWHEITEGVNHGYWDFRNSWLMSHLFPMALLVDAALASLFRVYLPLQRGRIIVCERYVLDMLVDLHLATHRPLLRSWSQRRLLALLPDGAVVIGLVAPESVLIHRRPELRHDHMLGAKLSAFEALYAILECAVAETVDSQQRVHERIIELASAHPKWRSSLQDSPARTSDGIRYCACPRACAARTECRLLQLRKKRDQKQTGKIVHDEPST